MQVKLQYHLLQVLENYFTYFPSKQFQINHFKDFRFLYLVLGNLIYPEALNYEVKYFPPAFLNNVTSFFTNKEFEKVTFENEIYSYNFRDKQSIIFISFQDEI